jgi:POT family proton-dependent oligopeptide transporter
VGTIFLLWNACLTCFVLTSSLKRGWWSIEDAMALYGTYTMWVYFTRNWEFLADRYLVSLGCCARCFGNDFGPRIDGSRNAFVFLYIGIGFLIIGMVCLNLI